MSKQLTGTEENLPAGYVRDLVSDIRHMVLSGRLPPGERVTLADLQKKFGVSVIPIREALKALEAEGLMATVRHRGTVVASLSMAELRDVYALRRMIEPAIAAQAACAATDEERRLGRRAFEVMEAIDGSDRESWVRAHRDFHWTLLDVDLGAVTARTIRQLWAVSERYVAMSLTAFRVDQLARPEHQQLIAAFEAGDGEHLATEWETHLHLVEQRIMNEFEHKLA